MLRDQGKPVNYYNSVSASWGLQAGVQTYSYVVFLITSKAIDYLKARGVNVAMNTNGWFFPQRMEQVSKLDLACITLDDLLVIDRCANIINFRRKSFPRQFCEARIQFNSNALATFQRAGFQR